MTNIETFSIKPNTNVINEDFLLRAYEIAVTPFYEASSGITYEVAKGPINTFFRLLANDVQCSASEAAIQAGIPDRQAANLYILFLLHWDCCVPECQSCTNDDNRKARKLVHENFNRDDAIIDLNNAVSLLTVEGSDVLDTNHPEGGANPLGLRGTPGLLPNEADTLFGQPGTDGVGFMEEIMFKAMESVIPGGVLYGAAASVVYTAEARGIEPEAVLAEAEARTNSPRDEEIRAVIAAGTYPGGPNSIITREEFDEAINSFVQQLLAVGGA